MHIYTQSHFTFTRYLYSLYNSAIIVSVYTFIFDWKISFRNIYKSTQKGVKLIVGTSVYVGRFPSFISPIGDEIALYFPRLLLWLSASKYYVSCWNSVTNCKELDTVR
jgi:hypothetical protein